MSSKKISSGIIQYLFTIFTHLFLSDVCFIILLNNKSAGIFSNIRNAPTRLSRGISGREGETNDKALLVSDYPGIRSVV